MKQVISIDFRQFPATYLSGLKRNLYSKADQLINYSGLELGFFEHFLFEMKTKRYLYLN
jgi:hypothetical protein